MGSLDGDASIIDLPEAMEPLKALYRQVRGCEHPDWADYEAAMERDRRWAGVRTGTG